MGNYLTYKLVIERWELLLCMAFAVGCGMVVAFTLEWIWRQFERPKGKPWRINGHDRDW